MHTTDSKAGSSLAVRPTMTAILAGLVLAACGGGGGDSSPPPPPNLAPVANAGNDRTVVELTNVQLNGTATDGNTGDTLTYSWSQTGGTAVTLTNASSAQASFDAPDVAAGAPETLTFLLTVTDSAGASDTDEIEITVQEPGDTVTISGIVSYEFVPANPNCLGLNYPLTETRRIRQATVQVLDATTNAVLGDDVSDDAGNYEISVDPGLEIFVRVRAELQRGGSPSWNVEVRDNTASTSLPLSQRPIYVLDSGDFDAGLVDQTRNLTATTGWNGTSYASTRAAAPFAILDSIYSAMQLVLTADAGATFSPLDAFWSVNNKASAGPTNIDTGDIGTSFYRNDLDSLFLLGEANNDTEEFDDHVIVHEWGHYFEDVFSRSDSIGGSHGLSDLLDMRVAFGEGWATALSGMALDNPSYCDTQGPQQASGFEIDIENDSAGTAGWFNELSILAMIYDLWDTDNDGADVDSIGFDPIFTTMTTSQETTAAHTSIFSFLDGLETVSPASVPFIDALRVAYDINGTGIYGENETNDAGGSQDVLPVYTPIVPDGTLVNVCTSNQFDNSNPDGNKLSEFRFLRMEIVTQAQYEFDVATDQATRDQLPPDDPDNPSDQSDPDVFFYLNGQVQNVFLNGDLQGTSGVANRENFTTPNELVPGTYALDVQEWRYEDENTAAGFPSRSCFDITITAVP